MQTIEIKYNPYKLETSVLINGDDVFHNANHIAIQDFIRNKIPLQTWTQRSEYRSWPGLLSHLIADDDSDRLTVHFSGRQIDFDDLRRTLEMQRLIRDPLCSVQIDYVEPKIIFEDHKMMRNVDHVMSKLMSDQFRKIIDEQDPEAASVKAYQELDENYQRAKNADFKIVFAGTYSSGKSTIINTLIRHQILPMANETTTTKICKIFHEKVDRIRLDALDDEGNILLSESFDTDSECLDRFQQISPTGQKITNPAGVAAIHIYLDLSHLYPINNREEVSQQFRLVIVDTPGTNSGNSVSFAESDDQMTNLDREITLDAINSGDKEMVVICAPATNYQSESIGELLREIHKAAKKEGSGFNDRFLFVMNRCDELGADHDIIKQRNLFANYLSSSNKWNSCSVYLNPKIYMTSAIVEAAVQIGADRYSREEIMSDSSKYQANKKYTDYKEKAIDFGFATSLLVQASEMPDYRKEEFTRCFDLAVQEKHYADAVSLQSGIPGVVQAIQDYIERYAYPCKVRSLLQTFDGLLAVVSNITKEQSRILESVRDRLGERRTAREEVETVRSEEEKRKNALKKLKERVDVQKREIAKISAPQGMQKIRQTMSMRLDTDPTVERIRFSKESVDQAEFDRITSALSDLFCKLQSDVFDKFNDYAEDYENTLNEIALQIYNIQQDFKGDDTESLMSISLKAKDAESPDQIYKSIVAHANSTKSVRTKTISRVNGEKRFFKKVLAWIADFFVPKTETVVSYRLETILKDLNELEDDFKAQCENVQSEIERNITICKHSAIKTADDLYADIDRASKMIDSYRSKIDTLISDEEAFTIEMQNKADRIAFLGLLEDMLVANTRA